MKIATATLFAPSNYGNALQMLSLQRYLMSAGYETEILSHWLSKNCDEVNYYHNCIKTLKGFVRFVIDGFLFGGAFSYYFRECRIRSWIEKNLRMSRESGSDEDFPLGSIKYEMVIVGSDQVWNPKSPWPEFHLLAALPADVKRIAYAASFGTDDRTFFDRMRYLPALKEFGAISVRESSAKRILEEMFGLSAKLVCDPTLLHTRSQWCQMLGIEENVKQTDEYVVYLVTPKFRDCLQDVLRLAKKTHKRIRFFAFSSYAAPGRGLRPLTSYIRKAFLNIIWNVYLHVAGVRVFLTATPNEFVRAVAGAAGVFTDSFHGVMFSTIFERPCNIVIGNHPERTLMSARLRNFTDEYGDSRMISNEFDVGHLIPASITPQLMALINESKQWLANALQEARDE